MMSHQRTIYILSGGHSRRMGTDKALLSFGEQSLLEYQIERCQPFFYEVLLLSGQRNYPVPVRHVHDVRPDAGPLCGLLSALRDAIDMGEPGRGGGSTADVPENLPVESRNPSEEPSVAIMAVDLPMVSTGVLRMMATTVMPEGVDAFIADAAPVPGSSAQTAGGRAGSDPSHHDTAPMNPDILQQLNWMTRQPLLGIYRCSVIPELEEYLNRGDGSVMGFLDRVRVKAFPVKPDEIRNINTREEYEEIHNRISTE